MYVLGRRDVCRAWFQHVLQLQRLYFILRLRSSRFAFVEVRRRVRMSFRGSSFLVRLARMRYTRGPFFCKKCLRRTHACIRRRFLTFQAGSFFPLLRRLTTLLRNVFLASMPEMPSK